MLSRDPSMPTFQLLSDSDGEELPGYGVPPPSKAEIKRAELNRWGFDGGDTDSSETDPTWSFRKKNLGGGFYSDSERSYEEEEDEEEDGKSVTSVEIRDMCEEDLVFAEPIGDPAKVLRYKQRVSRLRIGTWTKGGRFLLEESEEKEEKEEKEQAGDAGWDPIATHSRKKKGNYGGGCQEFRKKLKKDIV